jgi:hypothetical protein
VTWALLALLLAGCDAIFLQENAPPLGSGMCGPEYAGKRYLVITQRQTWADAERACSTVEGEHSHLAVVGTPVEGLEVAGLLASSDAWVGLTSLGKPAGQFHWITREPAAIPFIPGEPDGGGDCGRLLATGNGLADTPCDEERIAVCECDEFPVDEDRF